MVGIDPVAADIDAVEKLRDYHGVPVLSVHSPCLLITQRVWGTDPWAKLERSAEAATRLGAPVVVVHPPFRWQRDYGKNFVAGIKRLNETTGVTFCVENMYPWRTPGGELKAYVPGWDPTDLDYSDLTLDFSHASTANQQSLDLAKAWGKRLRHIHLTDGHGSMKDEHLVPGRGDQRAGEVLGHLAANDFDGHVVLEVNSRKSESRAQREADLAESLAFARLHLAAPVHAHYAVDGQRRHQRGLSSWCCGEALLGVSRSETIKRGITAAPVTGSVVARYVAGERHGRTHWRVSARLVGSRAVGHHRPPRRGHPRPGAGRRRRAPRTSACSTGSAPPASRRPARCR